MTVIIGYKQGGDVWMGADSFLGNSESKHTVAHEKIWRCSVPDGGPMLIGLSGSVRAGFLVRSMEPPPHPDGLDAYTYVAEHLVNAIRERYEKAGFLQTENGRERDGDSLLMVGYRGRLFEIYYDFDVLEYGECYAAVGAGQYIALGAMGMMESITHDSTALDRIRMVLEVCEHHSPWVRRPFVVMKVEEPKDAE